MTEGKRLLPDIGAAACEQAAPGPITISLSFEEMTQLLAILGAAPYSAVALLVETIQAQVGHELRRQSLLMQFESLEPESCSRA